MKLQATVVLGLLLGSQMLFVASTFRTWFAMIGSFALAALLVTLRERLAVPDGEASAAVPRWLRWILLCLLFATIAFFVGVWRIGSQVGKDVNPVYVAADIIAHFALIVSLTVWVMRPIRGHLAMLPLGLIVVLVSVAAGGASASLAAQTTVALASCLGFTLGSQIIFGSAQTTRGRSVGGNGLSERTSWLAPVFSLLTLSILMMGTSAIANVTDVILPAIQNRLQEQLKASLDSVGDQNVIGGTRYVRSGRLGSIRRHMLGNPREIALQVHCQVPPGYLRGSVFDIYRGGRWMDSGSAELSRFGSMSEARDHNVLPSESGSIELQCAVSKPLQRFLLVESPATQIVHLEVHNDPMKGPMVFLPLSTHWLEARSREIAVTKHGIVRLGVDVTRPYVAGVGTLLSREALSPSNRDIVLDVSTSVLPIAKETAERICQSATTAPAKASAISQYFQKEYGYTLASINAPRGVDPLTHFLEAKHDAHCEFFASATAIMLRTVGVPARYVTGYVTDELSEEQAGLWLARNQDAHAWVEAFDDQSGRWFPVESTPGRKYQTVEPDQGIEANDDDRAGLLDRGDDEDDSWFGRTIGWIASLRATDTLLLLFRLTQWPLFFGLLFVLWSRYLKPSRRLGDPVDVQSRKMLRQADRRVRRFALVREPSETLYQFADRIDQFASTDDAPRKPEVAERLSRAAEWYRTYANARYQGCLPQPIR